MTMSKRRAEGYYACTDFNNNEMFIAYFTGSAWFVCGVVEAINIDDVSVQRRIEVSDFLLH